MSTGRRKWCTIVLMNFDVNRVMTMGESEVAAVAEEPAARLWSVVYRLGSGDGLWSVSVWADSPADADAAVRWWAQHHHDAPARSVGVVQLDSVR